MCKRDTVAQILKARDFLLNGDDLCRWGVYMIERVHGLAVVVVVVVVVCFSFVSLSPLL